MLTSDAVRSLDDAGDARRDELEGRGEAVPGDDDDAEDAGDAAEDEGDDAAGSEAVDKIHVS